MKWILIQIGLIVLWVGLVLFIARFIGVCSKDIPRRENEES